MPKLVDSALARVRRLAEKSPAPTAGGQAEINAGRVGPAMAMSGSLGDLE